MDADIYTYLRAVLALAFVAGLMFLLAGVVRKTGLDKRFGGGNNAARRLNVVETLYIDPKNRLVVVKCDNKEHVLLLGASGNVLVESRTSGDKA